MKEGRRKGCIIEGELGKAIMIGKKEMEGERLGRSSIKDRMMCNIY